MRVKIASFSDCRGGAAIAASRFFYAISGRLDSVRMIVVEKLSSRSDVLGPSKIQYYIHFMLRMISYSFLKLQLKSRIPKHSLNYFSSKFVVEELMGDYDLAHLNWINNDTLSIEDVAKINKPIVISLHDEWFILGAEHSTAKYSFNRYEKGYLKSNSDIKGVDLNRRTWERKLKLIDDIGDKVIFTVPSTWLLDKAKKSCLLKDCDVRLLPNCFDDSTFSPKKKIESREYFNFPEDKKIVLFGAFNSKDNPYKGYAELYDAIGLLSKESSGLSNLMLVTFGGKAISGRVWSKIWGVDLLNVGRIENAGIMSILYSAADVTIVPSLVESFGQVILESLSCGTPVVSFDYGGMNDLIEHKLSGYIAESYSTSSLAKGVKWVLSLSDDEYRKASEYAAKAMKNKFSYGVISIEIIEIYVEAIKKYNNVQK